MNFTSSTPPDPLCCNIPIKVSVYISNPAGHIDLKYYHLLSCSTGSAWLPMDWFVAYFNLQPALPSTTKQRNINLNRTQQDERWDTSQHFLCISSISIRFLLPHLSSAADHIQTFSTPGPSVTTHPVISLKMSLSEEFGMEHITYIFPQRRFINKVSSRNISSIFKLLN